MNLSGGCEGNDYECPCSLHKKLRFMAMTRELAVTRVQELQEQVDLVFGED